MKRKIGIMGGTFHPIHYGHLIIAENAYEQYHLDQVIFMPTGHAPHKSFSGDEMTKHRCEMVRLSIEDNPHFSLSLREAERERTTYTYQTLETLHSEYPEAEIYFILGADSLYNFNTWAHPERICEQAVILAAVRDNLTERRVDEMITELREQYGARVHRINTPNFNVSSASIRERAERGQTIRYLLPPVAEKYILDHNLYRQKDSGQNFSV